MNESIRNLFTGEITRIVVTPLNGAHIVKRDGSSTEMHRGNAITARRYLDNLVTGQSHIYEYVR